MSIADKESLPTLTTEIVTAYVANNTVSASEVGPLISAVFASLSRLGREPEPVELIAQPAIAKRSSVKPDYLVCLEDGKRVKLLKPYIAKHFGLTPEEYRTRWGLPDSYPMVAPNYAAMRREMALSRGLGRKAKPAAVETKTEKQGGRVRRKLSLKV